MQIQVDTASIQMALDIISKTAPPLEGEVTFRVTKGKLTANSVADLSRCTVVVPCEVKGEGEFAILMQSLRDASKGRETLSLTYKEGTLTVKASGGYLAELATLDVIPADEVPKEDTKEWQLTADQATWLRKALKDVTLKPTSILSSWMPVGIKLSPNGAFVACYDSQHMSWVNDKSIKGDFECVMPLDTAKAVVEVFHAGNFVIHQSKNSIRVRNKLVNVLLSIPSTEDLPDLGQVRAKIKEAMAEKATTFKVGQKDMLTFIDNARAVVGKERAEITITSAKGQGGNKLELLVKTGQGQVKSLVTGGTGGTKERSFRVDLEYVQELISRAGSEIAMNVVDSSFLSIALAGSSAIVALNQE
jgi:hypothetical protein